MLSHTLFDLPFISKTIPFTSAVLVTDPSTVGNLTVWFRAEDLSFLGEGGSVGTGSSAWVNHVGDTSFSASQETVARQPIYTTTKFAGSKSGIHLESGVNYDYLHFSQLFNKQLPLGAAWIISILFKGNGSDSMLLADEAFNRQLRRFFSGNDILAYGGGGVVNSSQFSSSISQSAVCTFIGSGSSIYYYEGKYPRSFTAVNPNNMIIETIGYLGAGTGTCTGSFAEICVWTGSLSQADITNLYDNYWRVKYPLENLYVAP